MTRGGGLLITLILQSSVLTLANQNIVPIFISEIDTFLETDNDLVKESSVFECAKRCSVTSGCKSINYKKEGAGNNCYLNKKNRREAGESAVHANSNFVHYDIDYHIQRSQKAEFGTTNLNMPTVPPVVPRPCDSNPCQNGGTCVEVSNENRYECSCTNAFTGTNCEQTLTTPPPPGPCDSNPGKNSGTCSMNDNGCANAYTGEKCEQTSSDFELIFRGTDTTNYVAHSITGDLWFSKMAACAWISTPDIEDNQTMTVLSMMTESDSGEKKVITEQMDGQGGFHFSFGADRNDHPGHFSSTSFKDRWVLLCVRFRKSNQPYMDATVNVEFNSRAQSNNFSFDNIKIKKVVIGQDQDASGNIVNTHPFEGKISALNVWQGELDDTNTQRLYHTGMAYYQPLIKWPSFGSSSNRVGNVHYVSITDAGKSWQPITHAELVINKTSNVVVEFATDEDGAFVTVSLSLEAYCLDPALAPVDGLLISVPGDWKRIKFKQVFHETQQCYGIFGSVPSWFSGLPDPGVEEFDPNQDVLYKEEYLGANVNEYSGVNTQCGSGHFWMVNWQNSKTPIATISLRRKEGASNAGISTYGKCGDWHCAYVLLYRTRQLEVEDD